MQPDLSAKIRLDKWLFHARIARSRSLAQVLIAAGAVRVNGQRSDRPAHAVGPGDVLTLAQAGRVRVIAILACGSRRGPAPEAQTLYRDVDSVPSLEQER